MSVVKTAKAMREYNQLERALAGDRTEALELWKRVAAGHLDDADVRAFLGEVAHRVVKADKWDAQRRSEGLRIALFLEGKLDHDRALREETRLELVEIFSDGPADPASVARRLQKRYPNDPRNWLTWVRSVRDNDTRKSRKRT
jgi:hypothetical protein